MESNGGIVILAVGIALNVIRIKNVVAVSPVDSANVELADA